MHLSSKMNPDQIEQLIVEVSEYTELYDMSSKFYSDQNRRDNIWAQIGKKIGVKGEHYI